MSPAQCLLIEAKRYIPRRRPNSRIDNFEIASSDLSVSRFDQIAESNLLKWFVSRGPSQDWVVVGSCLEAQHSRFRVM